MADAYERCLVPAVFQPFAVDLAHRVAALRPQRVLELAAGTGVLTRELVASVPEAAVTATDLNDAMVELGRATASAADWRAADAMRLPFPDGAFDAVACQFGVMFFPDRPSAFAEARRVLTSDGHVLLNTWGPLEGHDFQAAVVAGTAHAYPTDPPRFMASVPHACDEPAVVIDELTKGGLECIEVETITLTGSASSASELAAGYCLGTPLRAELEARGDIEAAIEAVTQAIEAACGTAPAVGRMEAHIFEATPIA